MAKRAICDMCRKEAALEGAYEVIPRTWFKLQQDYADQQHICSLACLRVAVAERVAAAKIDDAMEVA